MKSPFVLDVYDSLLVRAIRCNPRRSLNMLKRVWAFRCALDLKYVEKECITFHLLEIVQNLNLISITDLVCKMHHDQYEFHHNFDENIKGYEYNNNVLNVCCSIIRLCPVEKLVGLRVPKRFLRNKTTPVVK